MYLGKQKLTKIYFNNKERRNKMQREKINMSELSKEWSSATIIS
jgi:hypothetical protein